MGHALLSHNHVLKPVLPDDGEDDPGLLADEPLLMAEKSSSRGNRLPIESGLDDAPSADAVSNAFSGETSGEKPCHR